MPDRTTCMHVHQANEIIDALRANNQNLSAALRYAEAEQPSCHVDELCSTLHKTASALTPSDFGGGDGTTAFTASFVKRGIKVDLKTQLKGPHALPGECLVSLGPQAAAYTTAI